MFVCSLALKDVERNGNIKCLIFLFDIVLFHIVKNIIWVPYKVIAFNGFIIITV